MPMELSSAVRNTRFQLNILDSIVVSIPACHAGDPGSIPGREVCLRGGHVFVTFGSRTMDISNPTRDVHVSIADAAVVTAGAFMAQW